MIDTAQNLDRYFLATREGERVVVAVSLAVLGQMADDMWSLYHCAAPLLTYDEIGERFADDIGAPSWSRFLAWICAHEHCDLAMEWRAFLRGKRY